MSKLFETLEKIQQNEPALALAGPHISADGTETKKKQWQRLLPVLLLTAAVVLIGSVYAVRHQPVSIIQVKNDILPTKERNDTERPPPELNVVENSQLLSHELQSRTAFQQMVDLNNQGTRFLAKNRYWQGIYYFDQARKIQPQSVEPLINLAVALSELGLAGPANRFFTEARKIDPDHPGLQENLIIAAKKGILHGPLALDITLLDFEKQE
ncbi:MAG: hypothetical protein U9R66_05145 [Thermodesulfobacteriota bacterium]|nr:hypothetical protein [Thermodesulfobacteriota bacterium]